LANFVAVAPDFRYPIVDGSGRATEDFQRFAAVTVENGMGEALIIDNFLSGFESFRDSLDSHIFSGIKSPVDDIFYSGVSADVPKSVSDNIKSKLDLYFGNVEIKFQFMRISQEGVFAPHEAHNDASMADYSMMLYLNRLEDCQGGTSFVSHIEEGMKLGPIDDKQFNIWESPLLLCLSRQLLGI